LLYSAYRKTKTLIIFERPLNNCRRALILGNLYLLDFTPMPSALIHNRLRSMQPLWCLPLALLLLCGVVLGGGTRSETTEFKHFGFVDQASPLGLFIHNQYACSADRVHKHETDDGPTGDLIPAKLFVLVTQAEPQATPLNLAEVFVNHALPYSPQAPRAPPSV
jgi:hypothetical protein